jgi:hypothetical protein
MLVTEKPATKGIRDAVGRSRWPLCFVSCTRDGHLQQMLWNQQAEQNGLDGMGVASKYSNDGGQPRLCLTWNGRHQLDQT